MKTKNNEISIPGSSDEVMLFEALMFNSLQRVISSKAMDEATVAKIWLADKQKGLGETINPWEFSTVHTLVSTSPFANISFMMDRRTRQNLSANNGKVSLYTTDEMREYTERQVEFLDKIGVRTEVVEVGSMDGNREGAIDTLTNEMQSRIQEGAIVLTTSGPPLMRQAMVEASKSIGVASIFTDLSSGAIDHIHGTQGIDNNDILDIDWRGISVTDVLNLSPGLRYLEADVGHDREFEDKVMTEFMNDTNIKLFGRDIQVWQEDVAGTSQLLTDIDIVLVLDNGVVAIECKNIGATTFRKEIAHTISRDSSRRWGRFSRRMIVVPDGIPAMAKETEKNPNLLRRVLTEAQTSGLDIVEIGNIHSLSGTLGMTLARNGRR